MFPGVARREAADKLIGMASQLEREAATARPLDAKRMREGAAATAKARTLR